MECDMECDCCEGAEVALASQCHTHVSCAVKYLPYLRKKTNHKGDVALRRPSEWTKPRLVAPRRMPARENRHFPCLTKTTTPMPNAQYKRHHHRRSAIARRGHRSCTSGSSGWSRPPPASYTASTHSAHESSSSTGIGLVLWSSSLASASTKLNASAERAPPSPRPFRGAACCVQPAWKEQSPCRAERAKERERAAQMKNRA